MSQKNLAKQKHDEPSFRIAPQVTNPHKHAARDEGLLEPSLFLRTNAIGPCVESQLRWELVEKAKRRTSQYVLRNGRRFAKPNARTDFVEFLPIVVDNMLVAFTTCFLEYDCNIVPLR